MKELTLESLAKRVEKLELQSVQPHQPRRKDWRRTIGMFADHEFMQAVIEESRKIREADREAGRNGAADDETP